MFSKTRLALTALGLLVIAGIVAPAAQADDDAAPAALDAIAQVESDLITGAATSVIAGHGTERWALTLTAGRPHDIFVVGDGDSDLDVFLYDEDGRLVDQDLDYAYMCRVSVVPDSTGRFVLAVRNRGSSSSVYQVTLR